MSRPGSRFSSRLPDVLAPNALSRAIAELRSANVPLLDLTETNPTRVGLPISADALVPLADARAQVYQPSPRGLDVARAAVAADYARRGLDVPSDRVVLVASTSEAYAILFKLLCDPGDEVLVPQPSYPLFELLTRLDGVVARPYRLDYHGRWSIDRDSLERALSPRTRAVLVVSPNNPTGSWLHRADRDWLVDRAAARGFACIADEVFADFPLMARPDHCSMVGVSGALTFALGGLSKSVGLPQVKLGWIAVSGPESEVQAALDRLDLINDTYLSASTPVQVAAASLLAQGAATRRAIAARVAGNLDVLRATAHAHPSLTLREPEGGWSAVIEVPAIAPEETLVLDLVQRLHVVVHPGYFFDFEREAFLVVSLLPEPEVFAQALDRLLPVAAGERPA